MAKKLLDSAMSSIRFQAINLEGLATLDICFDIWFITMSLQRDRDLYSADPAVTSII